MSELSSERYSKQFAVHLNLCTGVVELRRVLDENHMLQILGDSTLVVTGWQLESVLLNRY